MNNQTEEMNNQTEEMNNQTEEMNNQMEEMNNNIIEKLVNKIKKHYEIIQNIKTWRDEHYKEQPIEDDNQRTSILNYLIDSDKRVQITQTTKIIMDKYFTNYTKHSPSQGIFLPEKPLCFSVSNLFTVEREKFNDSIGETRSNLCGYPLPYNSEFWKDNYFPKIMFPQLDETNDEFEIRFLKELLSVCEDAYTRLLFYNRVFEDKNF